MNFYIDFEATQFGGRIIRIGCVSESGESFTTLVKPSKQGEKVGPYVSKLTSITDEMLKSAPTADTAFNDLFNFIIATGNCEPPKYYCYGNSDEGFLTKTIKYMTDVRAITIASAIKEGLIDYSSEVKKFFNSEEAIGLNRAFSLVHGEYQTQEHDPLKDALMLKEVVEDLSTKCVPEDKEKLANIPTNPKQPKKQAPQEFLDMPIDKKIKWRVDTGNEEDWQFKITNSKRVKYFRNEITVISWLYRYILTGNYCSIKNAGQVQRVKNKIKRAIETGESLYGFIWEEKH